MFTSNLRKKSLFIYPVSVNYNLQLFQTNCFYSYPIFFYFSSFGKQRVINLSASCKVNANLYCQLLAAQLFASSLILSHFLLLLIETGDGFERVAKTFAMA